MSCKFIVPLVTALLVLVVYMTFNKKKEGYRPGIGGPRKVTPEVSRKGIARGATNNNNRSRTTTRKSGEGYTLQRGGRRGGLFNNNVKIVNKNFNDSGYSFPYRATPYVSDGWYWTYPYTYQSYYPPIMYPSLYQNYNYGDAYPSYYPQSMLSRGGPLGYTQPQTTCFQTLSTFDAFGPYGSSMAGKQQWIDYAGRNGYANVSLANNSVVNDHAVLGYVGQCNFNQQIPPGKGYTTYDTNSNWW